MRISGLFMKRLIATGERADDYIWSHWHSAFIDIEGNGLISRVVWSEYGTSSINSLKPKNNDVFICLNPIEQDMFWLIVIDKRFYRMEYKYDVIQRIYRMGYFDEAMSEAKGPLKLFSINDDEDGEISTELPYSFDTRMYYQTNDPTCHKIISNPEHYLDVSILYDINVECADELELLKIKSQILQHVTNLRLFVILINSVRLDLRSTLCSMLESSIPAWIENSQLPGSEFKHLQSFFGKELFLKQVVKANLNCTQLGNLLINFSAEQCQQFLEAIDLSTIIYDFNKLIPLLMLLDTQKCQMIADALGQAKLQDLAADTDNLSRYSKFIDRYRFQLITKSQASEEYTFYDERMPIREDDILHHTSGKVLLEFFDIIEPQMLRLFISESQLFRAFDSLAALSLREFQRAIEKIRPLISCYITSIQNMKGLAMSLSEAKCILFAQEFRDKVVDIYKSCKPIYTKETYVNFESLTPQLITALFEVQPELASASIGSVEELNVHLRYSNKFEARSLIEVNSSFILNIVNTGSKLAVVLKGLNSEVAERLLIAIKGTLPKLLATGYVATDCKHAPLVKQVSAHVTNLDGFFSSKASRTFIGTIEQRLEQYLEILLRERYTFNPKDTKYYAALYVFSLVRGERLANIEFRCIDNLPDTSILESISYTNSYLWINNSNFYYVDFEGHLCDFEPNSLSNLQSKIHESLYFRSSGVQGLELTHEVIEDRLGSCFKASLPTTLQLRAMENGTLGEIISDFGGINAIRKRAESRFGLTAYLECSTQDERFDTHYRYQAS